MKRNLLTITILALSMTLFTNCEKEKPCENCPDTLAQLTDPNNPMNPFDKIGADHNVGLAFIRRNFQSKIDAIDAASPLEAEHYVFAKSSEFGGNYAKLHLLLRDRLKLKDNELLRDVDFSDFEKVLGYFRLDDDTRQALSQSIRIIMRMEPGSIEGTNAIINAIMEQERIIMANSRLENRDFALALLAVWRHSNYFWAETGNGPEPLKKKWWQITLADAICGGVGFLLGGPAGGVGLGVGASTLVAEKG